MKKLIIYTALGTILVTSGLFFANGVSAEELIESEDSFISRLSEKLGLKESEVVDVIENVHEEIQTERQAERAEVIVKALDEGKLTEREAEILNAMENIRMERGRSEDIDDWREYTPEQREALRDARHEVRQQEMRDALYNQGLQVDQDEMDKLHEKMLELGIGMYGKRGEKGLGMGSGMKRRYLQE
jgi:hypothetical protein